MARLNEPTSSGSGPKKRVCVWARSSSMLWPTTGTRRAAMASITRRKPESVVISSWARPHARAVVDAVRLARRTRQRRVRVAPLHVALTARPAFSPCPFPPPPPRTHTHLDGGALGLGTRGTLFSAEAAHADELLARTLWYRHALEGEIPVRHRRHRQPARTDARSAGGDAGGVGGGRSRARAASAVRAYRPSSCS